jgi:hypothetical protein
MRNFTAPAIRTTNRNSWTLAWRFVREQSGAATMATAAGQAARHLYTLREDPCETQARPSNARALAAWYLAAVRLGARRIGLLPGAFKTSTYTLGIARDQRSRGCWQRLPV